MIKILNLKTGFEGSRIQGVRRSTLRSALPTYRRGLPRRPASSYRKGSRTVGLADLKGRLPNGSRIGEPRGYFLNEKNISREA